jgi:hypothetical protein
LAGILPAFLWWLRLHWLAAPTQFAATTTFVSDGAVAWWNNTIVRLFDCEVITIALTKSEDEA